MPLTLRSTKGSELTHTEADANFSGLADGSLLNLTTLLPVSMGGTGSANAGAARTALGSGAIGDQVFTGATAAAIRSTLGSTATGDAVFVATTAAVARAALGSTTVGDAVFVAANAAAARTAIDSPSNAEAILDTLIAAKGDLIVGTANDTPAILPVGTNGTIPIANSAATAGLGYVAALTKAIHGWTYANGTDATNDINFNAGGGMDSTGVFWITGAAMAGKQLDVGWAPGAAAGMRNSGAAIADTNYHLYAVAKADGTQDYYAHTSTVVATVITALQAETGGADYLYARRMGWIKRVAGTIVAFDTYETEGGGIELTWDAPTQDVNLSATLTTTRRTDAVKVPLDFSVLAHLAVTVIDASSAQATAIYCPDQADLDPTSFANIRSETAAQGVRQMFVRTSASGTIAARSTLATVDTYVVVTYGFRWARRD